MSIDHFMITGSCKPMPHRRRGRDVRPSDYYKIIRGGSKRSIAALPIRNPRTPALGATGLARQKTLIYLLAPNPRFVRVQPRFAMIFSLVVAGSVAAWEPNAEFFINFKLNFYNTNLYSGWMIGNPIENPSRGGTRPLAASIHAFYPFNQTHPETLPPKSPIPPDRLLDAMRAYLHETSDEERRKRAEAIIAADVSDADFLEALKQAPVWPMPAAGLTLVDFDPDPGRSEWVREWVPDDPQKGEPALIFVFLHSDLKDALSSSSLSRWGPVLASMFKKPVRLVEPLDIPAATFSSGDGDWFRMSRLIRTLRMRHPVTERGLILLGEGTGADAALQWAVQTPGLFDAIIAIDGYPRFPYARNSYPLFVRNIEQTPILWMIHPPAPQAFDRSAMVFSHAAALANRGLSRGAPWVLLEVQPSASPTAPSAPATPTIPPVPPASDPRSKAVGRSPAQEGLEPDSPAQKNRAVPPEFWDEIALKERLAIQGPLTQHNLFEAVAAFLRAAESWRPEPSRRCILWVRQTAIPFRTPIHARELSIPPWTEGDISIQAQKPGDADDVIRGQIKARLGFIEYEIKDNTVQVFMENIERVQVTLSSGDVDFNRPIRILVDGKVRFEGLAKMDRRGVLEEARRDFDFSHLPWSTWNFARDERPRPLRRN